MQNCKTFITILFFSIIDIVSGQDISKSFELRYFSNDPKDNGVTDFKGETEIFDTGQRITFLRHYAEASKKFFNDPKIATKVVDDIEVRDALK